MSKVKGELWNSCFLFQVKNGYKEVAYQNCFCIWCSNVRYAHIKSHYPVKMLLLSLDMCSVSISYKYVTIIYTESRCVTDMQDAIPSWHNEKFLHFLDNKRRQPPVLPKVYTCSPLKLNPHFGATCRLCLQATCFYVGFLHDLFPDPKLNQDKNHRKIRI
jgi:hypothetical protein